MDTFEYGASDSAPWNYVMTIIAGSLDYDGGSVPVPSGGDIDNGWGTAISSQSIGPDSKPLPTSLRIVFFSYLENQFYRGNFTLPYDTILKLFQGKYFSPKDNKNITYHTIIVGVAPGGAVAIWLRSSDRNTEVFFGQAHKVDLDWSVMTNNSMPREEYIRESIKDSLETPETVAAMKKNGPPIGLWSRYRKRYNWQPEFTRMSLDEGLISTILYYNGERDFLEYPLDKAIAAHTRAIPSEMVFVWKQTKTSGRLIELYFNEAEIFAAFRKLGSNHQPLKLEVRVDKVNGKSAITIWLHNDKESIELKHTKIDNYKA